MYLNQRSKSEIQIFCVCLFSVSRRFSQILKRQTSLNHLCQVPVLLLFKNTTQIVINIDCD